MRTLADRINKFNRSLRFSGSLPSGIRIMNPFLEHPEALKVSSAFYRKFYNDNKKRQLILGINPGRFGAGLTGIPFTDPKRLVSYCNIPWKGGPAHEPSSVFVYDMIMAFGGPQVFYDHFYINSLSPLGFTSPGKNGKQVNYNYYDSADLTSAVRDFIIRNIKQQIGLRMHTDVCFCLGTGKNEKFLRKLNDEHGFFDRVIALEHPRYIMQYKAKEKEAYIEKYVRTLHDHSKK
ncbi:MAG TPA: uracil-DNA glycosylase family protein [Phnomibacter sp.]|nr:uracil-DNA glycosylase family protein [Phnomibacter sp.]